MYPKNEVDANHIVFFPKQMFLFSGVRPSTFPGTADDTILRYLYNGISHTTNQLSFKLRTRRFDAVVLHVIKENDYIKVSVLGKNYYVVNH